MTKFYARDAAIEHVVVGLLNRSLPKGEWTHAAHFAATLWLMRHCPEPPAAERMPVLIRAYNQAVGTPNTDTSGYHETITQASIAAARSFLRLHPGSQPLHEIVDLLMESPLGDPAWLLRYRTRERLFSIQARHRWIEPDLQPLPFER